VAFQQRNRPDSCSGPASHNHHRQSNGKVNLRFQYSARVRAHRVEFFRPKGSGCRIPVFQVIDTADQSAPRRLVSSRNRRLTRAGKTAQGFPCSAPALLSEVAPACLDPIARAIGGSFEKVRARERAPSYKRSSVEGSLSPRKRPLLRVSFVTSDPAVGACPRFRIRTLQIYQVDLHTFQAQILKHAGSNPSGESKMVHRRIDQVTQDIPTACAVRLVGSCKF